MLMPAWPAWLILLLAITSPAGADLNMGLTAAAAQHWSEALREFQPLADQGDSSAQVNLGNLYMRGLGVEQDYAQAYWLYDRAARQGNVAGQAKLGLMHYYGLGVKEDHAAAAEWFLKAAEQGDAQAALVLAEIYNRGDGVPRQPAEAYLWYSVAADLGKPDADTRRTALLDELSPAEINAALTRLNVWRDQQQKRLQQSAAPRQETAERSPAPKPKTGPARRTPPRSAPLAKAPVNASGKSALPRAKTTKGAAGQTPK